MWLVLPLVVALAGAVDRADQLAPGLAREAPGLTWAEVMEHALAAALAETPDAPAELLLALAGRESHWTRDPGGKCGVAQVVLHGRACRVARASLLGGYRAAARALDSLAADCRRWRVRSVRRCVDNYYAEGHAAGRRGWGVKCGRRRAPCDRGAAIRARSRRIASTVVHVDTDKLLTYW